MNSTEFLNRIIRISRIDTQRERYAPLFTTGVPSVEDELEGGLDLDRQTRASEVLANLGVNPEVANVDPDWARVSLGLAGRSRGRQDILSAAGYGIGARPDRVGDGMDFPDFESDQTLGLNPGKIRVLADLYYIHQFDRLGIFRVVDELARRTFDPSFDLGDSDAGLDLYTYIKRSRLRFPHEDRRRLLEQVFEGGGNGGPGVFKPLMGRLVESLIDYARVRNAGELVSSGRANGRTPSVYTRSAVIRAVLNMQRYMSDAGGGILRYLRDESGAQLNQCFDILQSSAVQRYWGGNFKSGIWAVVEGVLRDVDGRVPPIDRARTLAVHGRKTFYWLAANTNNVAVLTDGEIDVVSDHVQNWISAYRRPDTEPTWLEDDEHYYGDEEEEDSEDVADEMVGEAIREGVGEEGDLEDADVL